MNNIFDAIASQNNKTERNILLCETSTFFWTSDWLLYRSRFNVLVKYVLQRIDSRETIQLYVVVRLKCRATEG